MCVLEDFVLNLQEFLINDKQQDHNIIRKHTKKLDVLGDISFPLNISNWYKFLDIKNKEQSKSSSIFDYSYPEVDKEDVISELIEKSCSWDIEVKNVMFRNNDAHISFNKSSTLYNTVITKVLMHKNYGSSDIIKSIVDFKVSANTDNTSLNHADLTMLRIMLLKDVATNLVNYNTEEAATETCSVFLVSNPIESKCKNVLCGPVLNDKGVKSTCTASELYQKRSSDMRMMAQHKYGVQVKPNKAWEYYFDRIGKGSVTVEMLTNKPQKCIKITPNDLQSANKGASFIFYNCARLSALFKEFEKRISLKEYPSLPDIDNVDFSLLIQPTIFQSTTRFTNLHQTKSSLRVELKTITAPTYIKNTTSSSCHPTTLFYIPVVLWKNYSVWFAGNSFIDKHWDAVTSEI